MGLSISWLGFSHTPYCFGRHGGRSCEWFAVVIQRPTRLAFKALRSQVIRFSDEYRLKIRFRVF